MGMARREQFDEAAAQDAFILMRESGMRTVRACRELGIHRRVVYRWLEDEEFADRFDEAWELAVDNMDLVVLEKAAKGDMGAARLWLQTAMPSRYLPKQMVEHSGEVTFRERIILPEQAAEVIQLQEELIPADMRALPTWDDEVLA